MCVCVCVCVCMCVCVKVDDGGGKTGSRIVSGGSKVVLHVTTHCLCNCLYEPVNGRGFV